VTLAAVRSARALPDLRAALAQEYGLVLWFAKTQPDLVEGIRAQVVDKDRTPAWRPATRAALRDERGDIGVAALAHVAALGLRRVRLSAVGVGLRGPRRRARRH
jgi:enoyl-CoA hydratase